MAEHTKVKNNKNETLKAGCVVINDKNEVLLVTDKQKEIWTFPKGHAKPGETLEEVALREAKEETGYTVELIKRLSDITYTHGQTGELIRVAMFKAQPVGEPGKVIEETYSKWFPIQEVRGVLYKNLVFIIDELE